jgi:hypothetical protein
MLHRGAIGLTVVQLAAVIWSERLPASGGSEAVRLFRLSSDSGEQQRNTSEQAIVEAPLGPRGGVG